MGETNSMKQLKRRKKNTHKFKQGILKIEGKVFSNCWIRLLFLQQYHSITNISVLANYVE